MARNPHFDVSAAVVRQLGEELVSDEVTAIVELVKNAYDADATYANVVVNTVDAPPKEWPAYPDAQGFITIEDDGFGMSEDEITSGWLVISLSSKRTMKSGGGRTPKGRTPLGDKGLGRLSTQKLGENLEMVTRKDGSPSSSRVSFSWSAFRDDRSLSEVPVSISTAQEPERLKGTVLAMTGLRNPEVWRGAAAEQLVVDLSQIISPFPEARPFRVTLKIDGRPIDLGQVSERVRNAAVGRFSFAFVDGRLTIDGAIRLAKLRGNDANAYDTLLAPDNGKAFFEHLCKRPLPIDLRYGPDGAHFATFSYSVELATLGDVDTIASLDEPGRRIPADPGPFTGEIDDFLLRGDQAAVKLAGLANANEVQQVVKRQAGIKVFRDGFGIKPYGINGQDWLRLAAGWTSAGSFYGLRPQNVLGFVLISEASNSHLKEKTDREGFVANPWSQNFQRLVSHVASTIGDLYETIRRTFNDYRREMAERVRPLGSSRQVVSDAASVAERLASYSSRAVGLRGAAAIARERIQKVTDRVGATPVLSSAGERELADLLSEANAALTASNVLFGEMEEYGEQAKALADIVATLAPRLDVMSDQLSDFSELAGLGLVAETLSHEVQNQTDRLMQQASGAIKKAQSARPPNRDLVQFGQEVTSAASALRRLVGHLGPSLRYQRDKVEVIEMSSLVRDLKDHFKVRWEGYGFECSFKISGSDFEIETNRGRMLQVLDNLFINSEYWLKQALARDPLFKPEIHVDYEPYRVRVWDNGAGVDRSVEDALFEPFVTLKPKAQGRGLGLFINAQILESIGGQAVLLPDRNDQGRRFVFEIDLTSVAHG